MDTSSSTNTNRSENLLVEEGNTLTLSPSSQIFGRVFKQYRPRTIAEVQELIGIAVSPDRARHPQSSCCCHAPELATGLVDPADVNAEDPNLRTRARSLAYLAAREFVHGRYSGLSHWKDAADALIEATAAIINIVRVGDIEIANRATLIIAPNVQAVYANDIRLYGTGRIVCRGPVTIRAASMQGRIPRSSTIFETIDRHTSVLGR